jgi:hypothetical protein
VRTPDGKEIKNWRCQHCGHILAYIIDGQCTLLHPVKVGQWNAPILVCPVCDKEIKWYCCNEERL